ncbi:SusC/RagA family TonB-linked outer membrane protein [Tunicatimonas pelagia]|uniref:SusC/RagA family TonB-linked outer membrane protein n=1 Tax=Tunicatimonas pelagia TaxID=931531 RepID=UPI0026658142|nr:TonB-dependent receptor [Tunicatimonas pelagia]WKN40781.1 TonB-dependent receptor [Tunicatimonas pelagia]
MRIFTQLTYVITVALAVLWSSTAWAQEKTVSGTVTSDAEGPLPGVNVLVKGTSTGTVTDLDGNYRLNVPDGQDTIMFSSIGYANQEIRVGNQTTINVVMTEDVQSLSEVVVIGYGTQEKKDVTGALSTIKAEDFNSGVINTPEQLFQGKLSGVQVTQNGGAPGGAVSINIRGANSIRSGNGPLFVVDGVPLTSDNPNAQGQSISGGQGVAPQNPLNFINPNDIASIDILKDASAAAIYGSRAANGVVIITTKSGEAGVSSVEYSSYASVDYLRERLDLLSADEFLAAGEEFNLNLLDGNSDTDWQDELFRTAFSHNHSLSFSGGADQSSYRISLSALDQQGIIKRNDFTRYTARINANTKAINDRLSLSMRLTASRVEDNHAPGLEETANATGDIVSNSVRANPTFPVFNEDGTYFQDGFNNPIAALNLINDASATNRILGNMSASFELFEGLTYTANLGADVANSERRTDISQQLIVESNRGTGTINSRSTNSFVIDHTLNYTKEFERSRFEALLGYSYQSFRVQGSTISRTAPLLDNILITPQLLFGSEQNNAPSSFVDNRELQSYFGRLNYSLLDKYILTATVRADESSVFGPGNELGVFPSFAFGWRLSEEAFLEGAGFDDLKFRLGYGILGNQELPTTQQAFVFGSNNTTRFVSGGQVLPGLALIRSPNPNLKWEEQRQFNVGFDFSFLQGRVGGTIDYFFKDQDDLVVFVPTIQPAPSANAFINLPAGSIQNQGIELTLNTVNVDQGDFRWNTDLNFTYLDSQVDGLDVTRIQGASASGQGLSGTPVQFFVNGEAPNVFLGREFVEIGPDGENVFATGDGGEVDQFRILGDPIPNVIAGLTNSFYYGNWDFNFLLSGTFGNDIYNNTANALLTYPAFASGGNVTQEVIDEARATEEDVQNANSYSSRFIENGSFIRLTNVSLGYNFDVANIDWLGGLRLYVTGQNLFVITNYSGYDPEVNVQPGVGDNTQPAAIGIDNTGYPRSSTVLFGLNVSFK